MKTSVVAVLGLSAAALSTPALAQDALPLRIGAEAPIGPAATSTPASRAEALRSDAASIEASRIALERSRNPRVRNYANRVLVEREATTKAFLLEGSSLSATGRVVSDRQGIPTRLDNPVGIVLAPVAIAANLGTSIVGGVLGGGIDSSPAEPGRRVALGPNGEARIERLRAAPTARDFDRTYVREQARSDARTLALYQTYAQNGDSAAGRRFADEHAHSATLAGCVGG